VVVVDTEVLELVVDAVLELVVDELVDAGVVVVVGVLAGVEVTGGLVATEPVATWQLIKLAIDIALVWTVGQSEFASGPIEIVSETGKSISVLIALSQAPA